MEKIEMNEQQIKTQITIIKDGPILIDGDINLIDPDGNITEKNKTYLCRCGSSEKKPYCDGSHKKINFKD